MSNLLIYGPGHAGKSTIAKNLVAALPNYRVIGTDSYYVYEFCGKNLDIHIIPGSEVIQQNDPRRNIAAHFHSLEVPLKKKCIDQLIDKVKERPFNIIEGYILKDYVDYIKERVNCVSARMIDKVFYRDGEQIGSNLMRIINLLESDMDKWQNYRDMWNKCSDLDAALTLVGGSEKILRIIESTFMKNRGLSPHHNFLDLGCGCLRGTVDLIEYLDDGHFYGIDVAENMIEYAYERMRGCNVTKTTNLWANENFKISEIFPETKFDFILSASLFTHLLPQDVVDCLSGVKDVLAKNGVYYSTIFKLDEDSPDFFEGGLAQTYYKVSWIKETAEALNLGFQNIGKTTIGQHMLRFYTL